MKLKHVYVVMGNDFPDAIFSTQVLADSYVKTKKRENAEAMKNGPSGKIHWRWYSFDLDSKE